jgi:trehalose-phosphatase
MAGVIERLAQRCVVGIVSGRDLADVRALVPTPGIWLAGSHGFDMLTPTGAHEEVPEGTALIGALREAADELESLVATIPGARVERKRFAIALHDRQVDDRRVPEVEAAVDRVLAHTPGLRKTGGKRIFELRPDSAWDKGRALEHLLDRSGATAGRMLPVYLGDDLTDEDAFAALAGRGIGIVVESGDRPTLASYRLADPGQVLELLTVVADRSEATEP